MGKVNKKEYKFVDEFVKAKASGRPISQAATDRAVEILQEIQKKNKKFMTGR